MEFSGQALTIWTARAAALLYVCWAVLALRRHWRHARLASTAALSVYLLHVWCAFKYFYGWSHATAYHETARQTAELFGIDWGGGLYLNYFFTAIWSVDCVFSWLRPDLWKARPAWIRQSVHAFFAFMWLNATVVVWLLRAIR
jgi:hypothetical protein